MRPCGRKRVVFDVIAVVVLAGFVVFALLIAAGTAVIPRIRGNGTPPAVERPGTP